MHVHAACAGKRVSAYYFTDSVLHDTAEEACMHHASEARRAQRSPTSVVFFLGTQEEILFFRLKSMKPSVIKLCSQAIQTTFFNSAGISFQAGDLHLFCS